MTEKAESVQQTSGCLITTEDRPKVFFSCIYFITFLVYGASATVLGAALPSLSSDFHRSKSQFGLGFTSRGIGYLVGTILSAFLLQLKALANAKSSLTAASLLITGVATFIITLSTNFPLAIFLFFIQGIGFGGIDTMGNCGLPEMWGKRVQPWMQAMHSCFGLGGIVGPAMVGSMGYVFAFRMVGFLSFGPVIALVLPSILQRLLGGENLRSEGWNSLHDGDVDQVIEFTNVNHLSVEEAGKGINSTEEAKSTLTTDSESEKQIIAPLFIRLLVSSFFFIYVGAETGYAGWVASYAILIDVTQNKSKAAYLSAIFWAFLTIGRILAIPSAVYFSATTMIRVQLALIISGALFLAIFFDISYTSACWVSGYTGFALSSIFPVMMTIFSDYGFAMDPNTTSMFMVGATLGESIIPVIIGVSIGLLGSSSFPMSIIVSAVVLFALYLLVNLFCQQYMKSLNEGGKIATSGLSSHPLQPFHTILGEDDDDDEDGDEDVEEQVQLTLGNGTTEQEDEEFTKEDNSNVYHPFHSDLPSTMVESVRIGDEDQLSRDVYEYLNEDEQVNNLGVPIFPPPQQSAMPSTVFNQPISSPFHASSPFHPTVSDFTSHIKDLHDDDAFEIMQDDDDDIRL